MRTDRSALDTTARVGFLRKPFSYSEAIALDSSRKSTIEPPLVCRSDTSSQYYEHSINRRHDLPSVPGAQGRSPSLRTKTFVKVSLSPRLNSRLPFRQFSHVGLASSHFRWRFRHVKQPVRTLCAGGATRTACSDPSIMGSLYWRGTSPPEAPILPRPCGRSNAPLRLVYRDKVRSRCMLGLGTAQHEMVARP